MILAKVLGSVTCTIKHEHYKGKKILIVQPVGPNATPSGKSFLALDGVQSGIGDLVLVFDEGGSARDILGDKDLLTIRTIIGGIVDSVSKD
ncbi:MAG: EutN/CcmL family microcompartment protein [Sphaerochaetaceae bacterium]|jgi:microcompartment protein CcmK/EutM|nr:EutN/CcmL family microcompartment protein [Sphaerochaeta sp.]PKL28183.1 MAG: hypothetical protein CVV46_07490 [Spirochaetae bacterium HGW-Spirochaetae-2]